MAIGAFGRNGQTVAGVGGVVRNTHTYKHTVHWLWCFRLAFCWTPLPIVPQLAHPQNREQPLKYYCATTLPTTYIHMYMHTYVHIFTSKHKCIFYVCICAWVGIQLCLIHPPTVDTQTQQHFIITFVDCCSYCCWLIAVLLFFFTILLILWHSPPS